MKKIIRYNLETSPEQSIEMPFNSEILKLDVVNSVPSLVALIDDTQKMVFRKFIIFTDSVEIDQTCNWTNYLGSFESEGYPLHVFEK